jgi:hypothetical protein
LAAWAVGVAPSPSGRPRTRELHPAAGRERLATLADVLEADGRLGAPRDQGRFELAEELREKAAQRAETQQLDQLTIRQRLAHELNERKARIPQILDALVTKAEKGGVPAARELRGWYDQGLGKPEAASLDTGDVDRPYAEMTPEERARLRAGVIRRISEAEAALEGGKQAKA